MGKILSFLGGIGAFISGIAGYFTKKSAKEEQKRVDELLETVKNLNKTIKANKLKHESEMETLRIQYEAQIESINDAIDATLKPKIGGRKISG